MKEMSRVSTGVLGGMDVLMCQRVHCKFGCQLKLSSKSSETLLTSVLASALISFSINFPKSLTYIPKGMDCKRQLDANITP